MMTKKDGLRETIAKELAKKYHSIRSPATWDEIWLPMADVAIAQYENHRHRHMDELDPECVICGETHRPSLTGYICADCQEEAEWAKRKQMKNPEGWVT